MSDKKIIEEREEVVERPRTRVYDDEVRPRVIGGSAPRTRVSRYSRIVRDGRGPSVLSIVLGLLVAGAIAAGVYYYYLGHRSLNNDISELRSTSKDTATTAAVKAAFSLNKQLNNDSIDVATNNGVVTLDGQVDSQETSTNAENVARNTRGVTQVVNNLSITPAGQSQERIKTLEEQTSTLSSQADNLQTEKNVLEALLATDALKGQQVKVTVANHVATLIGLVDSQQQKDIAVATAQHVQGINEVKSDQLSVRYQQAVEPAPVQPNTTQPNTTQPTTPSYPQF